MPAAVAAPLSSVDRANALSLGPSAPEAMPLWRRVAELVVGVFVTLWNVVSWPVREILAARERQQIAEKHQPRYAADLNAIAQLKERIQSAASQPASQDKAARQKILTESEAEVEILRDFNRMEHAHSHDPQIDYHPVRELSVKEIEEEALFLSKAKDSFSNYSSTISRCTTLRELRSLKLLLQQVNAEVRNTFSTLKRMCRENRHLSQQHRSLLSQAQALVGTLDTLEGTSSGQNSINIALQKRRLELQPPPPPPPPSRLADGPPIYYNLD